MDPNHLENITATSLMRVETYWLYVTGFHPVPEKALEFDPPYPLQSYAERLSWDKVHKVGSNPLLSSTNQLSYRGVIYSYGRKSRTPWI
jgi:hypothetical protein